MSGAALWLLGAVLGTIVGWLAGRGARTGRFPFRGRNTPPGLTTSGIFRAAEVAQSLPTDPTLDTLTRLLADRSAEAVGLACAVVLRDVEGGPASIVAVSANADARLVGIDVPLESRAGRAITDGVPVVAHEREAIVRSLLRDRRRTGTGGVAVPIAHRDNLMAAADAALYRAKRQGRNRVVAVAGAPG